MKLRGVSIFKPRRRRKAHHPYLIAVSGIAPGAAQRLLRRFFVRAQKRSAGRGRR
jgi:hypothetical protein